MNFVFIMYKAYECGMCTMIDNNKHGALFMIVYGFPNMNNTDIFNKMDKYT